MVNLLVVDYDRLQCECIKKICTSLMKVRVHIAHTYERALEICKEESVHQALINVDMPKGVGVALLRYLRYAYPDVSLSMMSSYHSSEIACIALKYKVNTCLHKPICKEEIEQVIISDDGDRTSSNDMEHIEPFMDDVHISIRQGDFLHTCETLRVLLQEVSQYGDIQYVADTMYVLLLPFLERSQIHSSAEFKQILPLTTQMLCDGKAQEIGIFKLVDMIYRTYWKEQQPLLYAVLLYIHDHIYEDISLKDIVVHCNVSQGYISRLFKMKFNMTVMQYIHYKKMNMAKEYLSMTELSGTDISHKLGYSDVSYFCKIFKKYANRTISQYRDTLSVSL